MRKNGLTIIELLLAISILITITAIIVPTFRSALPGIKLRSEANNVLEEIRKTQQLAISANMPHKIRFITLTDKLVISRENYEEIEEEIEEIHLDPSVSLHSTSFSSAALIFNVLGEPSEGGTVVLQNTNGDQKTITVAPSTGKLSLPD